MRLFEASTQTRICGPESHCVLIVRASISLALTTIAMYEQHVPDSQVNKLSCKDKTFTFLDKALRNWIENSLVIGKGMFGGNTVKRRFLGTKLEKVKDEILVSIYIYIYIPL